MIAITDMQKIYQMGDVEVPALRGVSFTIEPGEFVAIMGPSGSGKSTLMNMIGCLDTPTTGSYRPGGGQVAALDSNALATLRARGRGFVVRQCMLLPRQNALRQVEMPLIYRGVPTSERHRRAETALRIVGMGQRMSHKPNELSGGQQQRVAIARAMVGSPAVLLADEPTGDLDSKTGEQILGLLRALVDNEGVTLLMATHDPAAAAFATDLYQLRDGQIASYERRGQAVPV